MKKRAFSTDLEIKRLKPAEKWYDVKDKKTRNLFVRVGPLNSKGESRKTFCLITRFPGAKNPVRHSFGEYGDLSLEQARAKVDEWRAQIRNGVDPREAEVKARNDANRKRDLKFSAVIEDYIARHLKGQRRAAAAEREIRKELIPVWANKPVGDITRSDVVALVEAIVDRPAPYQAHNVFGHIRTFFNWAIDRGKFDLEVSPCDRLKPARLIGEKKPRQRVLDDREIKAYWEACGSLEYPYGPLFKLLMVTGQRKSEVAEARWREFHPDLVEMLRNRAEQHPIDWSKVSANVKIWTVPPERFKSDSTHLVPLTDDALRVLETIPYFSRSSAGDYLFSTTMGFKPVNGFSKAKERLDREMLNLFRENGSETGLASFVLHDIRRTVRTRLSSLRVSERIAEMVIGHGRKGLVRVYDQHEFTDEMREALEKWAGAIRAILNPPPENVVSLEACR